MKKVEFEVFVKDHVGELFSADTMALFELASKEKQKEYKEQVKRVKEFEKQEGLAVNLPNDPNRFLVGLCEKAQVYFPSEVKQGKVFKITIEDVGMLK